MPMIPPYATRVTCSPPVSFSTQTSRRSLTCRSVYGAGRTRYARCSAAPPRSSRSTTNGLSAALTWTSTCRRSSLSRRDPPSPPSAALHTAHAYTHTHAHTHIHRPLAPWQEYVPTCTKHPAAFTRRNVYLRDGFTCQVRPQHPWAGLVAGRLTLTLNLTPDSEPHPHL